jgi:hypothetical protein
MADAGAQLVGGRRGGPDPSPRGCEVGNTEIALRERIKELTCLYRFGELVDPSVR